MKLGNLKVAQLQAPKKGLFSGRHIPQTRLDDMLWLRLLELPEPPQDGLYIRRSEQHSVEPKRKSWIYRMARAMAEYDASNEKQSKLSAKGNAKPAVSKAPAHSSFPSGKLQGTVDSWLDLSPDLETELLGLEQLQKNEHLAIVGCGITGLTLAYMVSRARPDIRITLIDSNKEVGGWMMSRVQKCPNGGEVLFECGPRTLLPSHPGSEIVKRIMAQIGKRADLMGGVSTSAGVNAKALVYNNRVQFLPNNLKQALAFLCGPLMRGGRLSALRDLFSKARDSEKVRDESVDKFISRRLGSAIAERFISAVMRGIYAADSRVLSARSVARLNRLFYLEGTEQMGILAAAFSGSLGYLESYARKALPLAFDALTGVSAETKSKTKYSLWGFPSGIQSAAKAIAAHLSENSNITFKLDTTVTSIEKMNTKEVRAYTSNGKIDANVLVSTVAKPNMFKQGAPVAAELMASTKYSSLAVVNVWVPDEKVAKEAFGVLVPRCENDSNPEGMLGVIFDSSIRKSMQPLDGDVPSAAPLITKPAGGSCMTVMLGGDMWDPSISAEEWGNRALRALVRLKILDEGYLQPGASIVTRTTLQCNAIPLYEVGHSVRQQKVHENLANSFGNRVALVGMAFGRGCGVSDCVVDAEMIALRFAEQRKLLYPQFFFEEWLHTTHPEYYV